MKRIGIILLAVVPFLSLENTVYGFEKKALLAAGGKEASGTVMWVGTSQFFLMSKDGEKVEYLCSQDILLSPESRRLMTGDLVELIYFEPENVSGSKLPKISNYVEIHGDQTFSMNQHEWLDALIISTGAQSDLAIPALGKTLRVENLEEAFVEAEAKQSSYVSIGRRQRLGKKIKVKIMITPQYRGCTYLYTVEEVKL